VHADAIRTRDDFPNDVGDALAFIAAQDVVGYADAVESVLESFETRDEYFWGYTNMTTVNGMFAAGDASGASSHKFSSGSHAEGRIAAKAAIAYVKDHGAARWTGADRGADAGGPEAAGHLRSTGATTDRISPYIRPRSSRIGCRSMDEPRAAYRASSRPATSSSRKAWSCWPS
jgi:succinate dehydrogenase/fumarate reductase flavoprotein subunit